MNQFSSLARTALVPLVGCLFVAGGCATPDAGGTARLSRTEKMFWSTYAIATPKAMATCVVVNSSSRSSAGSRYPVLITSAHVLAVAPRGPFFLAARVPDKGGNPLVLLLAFRPAEAGLAYIRHPDYDVAAIEVPIPPEMAQKLALPSFISEGSIGDATDAPRAGAEVTVLGFPKVLPGTAGAFPVLRAGRIASYTAAPEGDWGKFVINTNVYPGDSGAPVFAAHRRGRLHLLGMVSERIGPRDGSVPLAVAVNARVIRETLQLLKAAAANVPGTGSPGENLSAVLAPPATVKLLGTIPKWMEQKRAELRRASHPRATR
jgi:hypothetical protein